LFGFLSNLNYFFAFVKSAVTTDGVWQAALSAILAINKLQFVQMVMRPLAALLAM
jgi:hypothetical protein